MRNDFPQKDKRYIQTNRSNVLGNLWSTFNLDFQSNLGVMRVTPRLKLNTSTADDSDLALPVAFRYFDSNMWAICGAKIFKCGGNLDSSQFSEDASAGVQTDYSAESDMEVADGVLVTSTTDALYKKASDGSGTGAWTSVGALTSGVNHKIAYFKKFDRFYVTDNTSRVASSSNALTSVDTTGDYTLTIANPGGNKYVITCMKASSSSIWIGTVSLGTDDLSNRGVLFEWDGISAQASAQYLISAHGISALIIGDDDYPYVMDSNGILSRFTGSGLEEVGRLPISKKLLKNAGQTRNGQFIDANGLALTKDKTILALVNGINEDGTQNEQFASGIYEFDLKGGCTHKYSFSYNPISSSTITDFGQERISFAGALLNVSGLNFSTGNKAEVICGATYYTNATTTTNGIFVDDFADTIQKKGYAVTTWIESDAIENTWDRFWAVYRRFLASSDSINLKYRLSEVAPVEATITWVNTTSFTTTTDITGYGPTASGFNGTVGGEVEILQGTGGGSTAHITNISFSNPTYTVTIDTAITGVTTGTAIARFQKWIKLFPAKALDQVKSYSQWNIGGTDTRIQLKICFTYTGQGEFYKSFIVSNEDIKALG